MNKLLLIATLGACALAGCAQMPGGAASAGKRELMVVGNDEKAAFNDAGAIVISAPGKVVAL